MKIKKEEKQDIEFKQSWRDEYLKWICAFANTNGGTLYIGVQDDGEVCGVEDAHKLSEDIPNKILHTMGLICGVDLLTHDDKKYFQITVEKSLFPVSYHGKYYKRSGSTTQEVTGFELDKMILSVQGRTWDSVPVPHVTAADLDETAFKIFKMKALQRHRLSEEDLAVSREDLLHNLHCYEADYLTRAALLAFHPDPEKWFTCAYIKIAYFENEADILYQDEVHGSLLEQVEKAMEIIYVKYMKALISYEGITRRETYFFPPDAFRELLLNALIHKDYMQPTPIQIQVFRDKINIWNFGAMPSTLSVSDLYKLHRSIPRNPNLASIFFRCGYVESWGRGYSKITRICKEWNAKIPTPEVNTGGLAVECLASAPYIKLAKELKIDGFTDVAQDVVTNVVTNVATNVATNLTPLEKNILDLIKGNKTISASGIATQLSMSSRQIQRILTNLKEKHLLVHVGATKNGYWKILDGDSDE